MILERVEILIHRDLFIFNSISPVNMAWVEFKSSFLIETQSGFICKLPLKSDVQTSLTHFDYCLDRAFEHGLIASIKHCFISCKPLEQNYIRETVDEVLVTMESNPVTV